MSQNLELSQEEIKRRLEKLTSDLKDFLSLPLERTEVETVILRTGELREMEVQKPNTPPLLSRFARSQDLTVDQLEHLADQFPPLRRVMESYEDILKEFGIHHGLLKNYDGNFAKFFLTNATDMRDTKQIEVKKTNIHAKIAELEAEGDPLVGGPAEPSIPLPPPSKPLRAFTLPASNS